MAASGTIRIVMAEDSATDAELTRYALRRAGIAADIVLTTTEAELRAALRSAPDVIISDNAMPGFSGTQALAIARELAPQAPFIVLSGSASGAAGSQNLSGVAAWLDKKDLHRLGDVIRDVLGGRAR